MAETRNQWLQAVPPTAATKAHSMKAEPWEQLRVLDSERMKAPQSVPPTAGMKAHSMKAEPWEQLRERRSVRSQ